MFTIKAVTDSLASGFECVKLFTAERVLIAPAGDGHQEISAGVPTARTKSIEQPAELRIHLMDERDLVFETIDIGLGPFNFNRAYVLNEKGRTVQTILPPSTHPGVLENRSAA